MRLDDTYQPSDKGLKADETALRLRSLLSWEKMKNAEAGLEMLETKCQYVVSMRHLICVQLILPVVGSCQLHPAYQSRLDKVPFYCRTSTVTKLPRRDPFLKRM
jgi:hypothetical protein